METSRKALFDRLFGQIADVPGNVAECGVYNGTSLVYLAWLVHQEGKGRTLWGFDLWDDDEKLLPIHPMDGGIPPLRGFDEAKAAIFAGLSDMGLSWKSVQLKRGLFRQSLQAVSTGRLALLHIDADLFYSYFDALTFLWPRLNKDGVVILDEYGAEVKWQGAKAATDEYLAALPDGSWELHKEERVWLRKLGDG